MIARSGFRMILGAMLATAFCAACANGTSTRNLEMTHDGLERVPDSRVDRAWVKPGVDFSQYTAVSLLDCSVSFRRNWRMRHSDVRERDIERIKSTLADEVRQVFTEALESGGHAVVTDAGDHVLLIRPAINDLDVAAPDTNSGGRSDSFTTSPVAMTLVLELHDSVSNEILARAVDRRRTYNFGHILRWTTRGTNREAARRILRIWANQLVSRIDEIRSDPVG